jgi:hypothetical protein
MSSPRVAWLLRMGEGRPGAGHHSSLLATRSWTPVDLRGAQHLGSTMGAHHRHTTPEMATRVITAIQDRPVVVVGVAEQLVLGARARSATAGMVAVAGPQAWPRNGRP